MKKFCKKILLFLVVPIFFWGLVEALLIPTIFTYRHWEAYSFQTKIPAQGPWYPNIMSFMIECGDLCHHTRRAITRNVIWKTDKLGFRNDSFVNDPDILLIGDSFTAGCGLSQESTITNQLKLQLKETLKVYNMAPVAFSKFDYFFKMGVLKKPALIIYSIVERDIPESIYHYQYNKTLKLKYLIKEYLGKTKINVGLDKIIKRNSFRWLKARIYNSKGVGVPGIDSIMFFYKGADQEYNVNKLDATFNIILSYKKYCDSLGIDFLFVPMPDKETVYYDLVPLKDQPKYLFKLDSLLHLKDVPTINTLNIYNDYRKKNTDFLYYPDDTHWNLNATELVSKEIAKRIMQKHQIVESGHILHPISEQFESFQLYNVSRK